MKKCGVSMFGKYAEWLNRITYYLRDVYTGCEYIGMLSTYICQSVFNHTVGFALLIRLIWNSDMIWDMGMKNIVILHVTYIYQNSCYFSTFLLLTVIQITPDM